LGIILFVQFIPLQQKEGVRGVFSAISLILIMGFLLFSSVNFFSDRYLVGMIPFLSIGITAVLYSSVEPWHKALFPSLILVIVAHMFIKFGQDSVVRDTKMSYIDDIYAHQKIISECEALNLQNVQIYGSFIDITYMTDTSAGYLKSGKVFKYVNNKISDKVQYAIIDQSSPTDITQHLISLGFIQIKSYKSGPAWCALYKKTNTRGIVEGN
jgi:hypothetical protein